MATSNIEWTDETWNPIAGCSRVSPGCGGSDGGGCYAERMARRLELMGQSNYSGLTRMTNVGPRWTGAIKLIPEKLAEPLRWKKPRRVFVNSMSDLFHEDVPFEYIDRVYAVMLICCLHETRGGHTFQILSKRAARQREYLMAASGRAESIAQAAGEMMEDGDNWHETIRRFVTTFGCTHSLIWQGVSAEDQPRADERIPELLATPAAVRFVSAEPLLGPIEFDFCEQCRGHGLGRHGTGQPDNAGDEIECGPSRMFPPLDWVIVGGESGPKARPFDLAWARGIVWQCRAAGVPCFYKQGGASHRCEHSPKGGCLECTPEDLRVREWPRVAP